MYELLQNKFFIIVGPNVIESESHAYNMAQKLKTLFSKYDVNFIFKISFDKANRSSLNSYRGLGFDEGLRILKKIKDELNVPIITDIHESWQAEPVAEVVDIIQIPAFLCRQTDLLQAAAKTGKIIHVKKGQFCSAAQMHKCKEKIIAFGNPNVILCERGNSFGYQDLVVDPRNLIWLKSNTNLVSMDITHCLQQPSQTQPDGTVKSGGLRELIPYMGKMAIALGVNGIFMEVHDRPDESKCDAPTQWPLDKLEWLLGYLEINKLTYNLNYISSTTNKKAQHQHFNTPNLVYKTFIDYHYLFRNPCGEDKIINNTIFKLIEIYKNVLIIDGGFNIGNWSKSILNNKSKNIQILGFEPNRKILKKQIIKDSRLNVIEKGISDNIEKIYVNDDDNGNNNSESFTLTETNNGNYLIDLTSLDKELEQFNFDHLIIKLDIESYEYKALIGLQNNLDKTLIIQFEYHNFHKNNQNNLKMYLDFLMKNNFKLFIIGEYELLNITDNWYNGFDICIECFEEKINKRPDYLGGNPDYTKINKSIFKSGYRPENINLLAINNKYNLNIEY